MENVIEDMIAAVVKDIFLNADAAQKDPKFSSGRFAVACRGYGDDLKPTVERLARDVVEHRFATDLCSTVGMLMISSDKTRMLVFTQMIAEVVKRLVSSTEQA